MNEDLNVLLIRKYNLKTNLTNLIKQLDEVETLIREERTKEAEYYGKE